MSGARETRRAVIVLVLLVAMWGYSWITSKIGLDYASSIDVVAMRLELGMLTLLAWFVRTVKLRLPLTYSPQLPALILFGFALCLSDMKGAHGA